MWRGSARVFLSCLLSMGIAATLLAQTYENHNSWPAPKYKVRLARSVMVPMRDGVKLSTDLYFPEGAGEKLPVILVRTPYNKKLWRGIGAPIYSWTEETSPAYRFASQGYLVAVQDTRGRFESEGSYRISFPDAEDGYDTTSWLATQQWSNGKVGTYGCSYVGDVQILQSRLRNPNLAAMIPQASGSSFPHRGFGTSFGGAIEVAAGLGWFTGYGSKFFLRPPADGGADFWAKMGDAFNPGPVEPKFNFQEIWRTLPLIDMVNRAGGPPTDWEDIVTHRPKDPFWTNLGYLQQTDRFDTPALQINSWYDFGVGLTLDQFNLMRVNAVSDRGRNNQFFVISPTTHCMSETATEHTVVGQRDLGDARFDYHALYLRWFDYWLKGIDNGVTKMPKLQIYVMGKNQWRGENEWPLARTQFTKYYVHSDGNANSGFGTGTLDTSSPPDESPDHYPYDPATPVPSVGGPVCCTGTADAPAGSFDQSEVEARHDVLVYSTPVLEKGVEVTGPILAVLYVSSSALDTDFTAKLIDVYPNGKAYNVQEGILRARYREGWEKKVWMKPGEVYELTVDMEATSNYFGPGHRIRLEISSSNFPRFDRNLNTGGNNYDETQWVAAKNTIHHSKAHASYILLPVIP
jgi:putative CocE/NonD family hydrolase